MTSVRYLVLVWGLALLSTGCATNRNAHCQPGPAFALDHFVIASDTTPPGTIHGYLVSLPDSGVLRGAVVFEDSSRQVVYADTLGHFAIRGVRSGWATLRFRMIEHQPGQLSVQLPMGHGVTLRGGLGRSCPLGPTITTS